MDTVNCRYLTSLVLTIFPDTIGRDTECEEFEFALMYPEQKSDEGMLAKAIAHLNSYLQKMKVDNILAGT
jgi:hypothetical protein